MRRIVTLILTVLLSLLALPRAAEAHHLPNTFCSASGDVCQSTRKVDGIRMLRISLAAKYFDRYKLCVRAPDETRVCHRFYIHDQGATFGSSVRWRRHFPNKGPGPYVVVWRQHGHRVGARLGFHVRVAA
jgi:hypothetical protein